MSKRLTDAFFSRRMTNDLNWPSLQGEPIVWYRYEGAWYEPETLTPDQKGDALPYTSKMVARYNERVQSFRVGELAKAVGE